MIHQNYNHSLIIFNNILRWYMIILKILKYHKWIHTVGWRQIDSPYLFESTIKVLKLNAPGLCISWVEAERQFTWSHHLIFLDFVEVRLWTGCHTKRHQPECFSQSCKRRNSLYVSSTPVKFVRFCTFSRELMSSYVLHTCHLLVGRCSDCSMYLDPFSSCEGNLDRTIGVLHFKLLSPNMVMPSAQYMYINRSPRHLQSQSGSSSQRMRLHQIRGAAGWVLQASSSAITKIKVCQICTFLLIILF
jgi:hypothetical protein